MANTAKLAKQEAVDGAMDGAASPLTLILTSELRVAIPKELLRSARIRAAMEETSVTQVVIDALREWLGYNRSALEKDPEPTVREHKAKGGGK